MYVVVNIISSFVHQLTIHIALRCLTERSKQLSSAWKHCNISILMVELRSFNKNVSLSFPAMLLSECECLHANLDGEGFFRMSMLLSGGRDCMNALSISGACMPSPLAVAGLEQVWLWEILFKHCYYQQVTSQICHTTCLNFKVSHWRAIPHFKHCYSLYCG